MFTIAIHRERALIRETEKWKKIKLMLIKYAKYVMKNPKIMVYITHIMELCAVLAVKRFLEELLDKNTIRNESVNMKTIAIFKTPKNKSVKNVDLKNV